MVGELLATFCERCEEGGTQSIELWTYPDHTLNVVVTRVSSELEAEFSFPVAPHQVASVVLDAKPLRTACEYADLTLERHAEHIVARINHSEEEPWEHRVPADSLHHALQRGGFIY